MRGRVMGIWALIFGGMIPLGSLEASLMAIGALAGFITLQVIRKREAQLVEASPLGT